MRAAEELRQQQRYAAYVESQKQAEQARIKAQEERRRKLEEMHQRAEARRSCVLQRRQELELSNKARLELLWERSRTRESEHATHRRRFTESSAGIQRTASASPSVGSTRNPNHLMTTSCVVAFGSSAPRSICTQPSPAALRRQKAFEARLASYLTGRHSGCFLTASASPYYTHLLDSVHQPLNPSTVAFVAMPNNQAKGRANSSRHRRAVSAHASISRHTKASLARADRAAAAPPTSLIADGVCPDSSHIDSKSESMTTSKHAIFGKAENQLFVTSEDEVSHNRSASSQECNAIGRPAPQPTRMARQQPATKPASVRSTVESCSSSMLGSSRSSSVDALPKNSSSTHSTSGSVFERLASQVPRRNISSKVGVDRSAPAKPRATSSATSKKPPDALNVKRPPSTRTISKAMSVSVYQDRTECKASVINKKPARKRSVSPKPTPAPADEPKPTEFLPDLSADVAPTAPKDTTIDQPEVAEVSEPSTERTDVGLDHLTVTDESTEVTNSTKPDSPVTETQLYSQPLKAEIQGSGEGGLLKESEAAIYRAKFSEQRRLAKERKEEEQRRFLEAQQQLQLQEAAARLAAEQAERERMEQAEREAAEAQRLKDEAEKAKLRAAEAERLMKLQRAEEERIKRKQRLEDIMARVKQTPKPSASSPPSSASTPFLFGHESHALKTDTPQGDVSDSKLLQFPQTDFVLTTEGGGSDHDIPVADKEPNSIAVASSESTEAPVRFTLTDTLDQFRKPQQAAVESPNGEFAPEDLAVQPVENTDSHVIDISDDHITHEVPSAGSPAPQSDVSPSVVSTPGSVPLSPSKQVCDNVDDSTIPSTKPSAPQFKSALLQTMLGGGRLATRAKDAVAGLRSRASASQLTDIQPNGDHSDGRSFQGWTEPSPSGDGPVGRYPQTQGSPVYMSPKEINGDILKSTPSSMVQSMYEGSIDRVHVNGSRSSIPRDSDGDFLDLAKAEGSYAAADDRRSVGSPRYAWAPNADRDIPKSESRTSVPLPTSTS
ncbi:hypothetical protein CRM22_006312 [Opisthorchis felineus]|uniref:MAP7 domain-containing protein n=1 Tax=Opisthorchis felineus TaxID=147828 RepID=A0A4S2LLN8_OPIFE|nr:hypothetical protein CRM22_006312 [Opisthorchis felineus]